MHLAIVAVAILIGYVIKKGLTGVEGLWLTNPKNAILGSFPLFPLAMVGGVIVQKLLDRSDHRKVVDRRLMRRLQGLALDYLVVAALATLKIEAIITHIIPFAILMVAGIAWNVWCVMFLARRMLPDCWFERSHRRVRAVDGRHGDRHPAPARRRPEVRDEGARRVRLQAAPARTVHGRRPVDEHGHPAALHLPREPVAHLVHYARRHRRLAVREIRGLQEGVGARAVAPAFDTHRE